MKSRAWRKFSLVVLAASASFLADMPADAGELHSPFDKAIERAVNSHSGTNESRTEKPIHVLGGITPHHDLALPMIARFYAHMASGTPGHGRNVKRVWLFAPDHFHRVRNLAAVCSFDWTLSTGILEADGEASEALGALRIVETGAGMENIFAPEHGITLHIPLIARYFPNAKVAPVLLNPKIPDVGIIILRNKILDLFRDGDVIILSMDLSHYKTPEGMAAEDERTLGVLTALEPMKTGRLDIDARRAAALVLMLFKKLGVGQGRVLEHADSSDILGRRIESGTSYATVVFESAIHPVR